MFRSSGLSVLCYANGFTMFHYATKDKMAKVMKKDYFADMHTYFNKFDKVLVCAGDGYCELIVSKVGHKNVETMAIGCV